MELKFNTQNRATDVHLSILAYDDLIFNFNY